MKSKAKIVSELKVDYSVLEQPLSDGKRQQIGLLGGTFNPPHYAHLLMANQVCQQLGLDKILFMPDAIPPHIDSKEAIAATHRLRMVELAIEDNPNFEVEPFEIERGGVSYTSETIKALKALHPDWDIYFIIGGDMVAYLPKWHQIDSLVKEVQFVGVNRPGYLKTTPYPIMWVDMPLCDVSSTFLRERIQKGCSVKYLMPDAVIDYIEEEGLYHDSGEVNV